MLPAPKYDIHEALRRLEALQVFPDIAVRIHEVVKDHQSTLDDMEKAVSLDPALAARLLKVANSPFYGLNRKVPSVRRAVQLLGFYATRDLAMALAVGAMGKRTSRVGRAVWEHSVMTGIAARRLAKFLGRVDANQAFVSGLLHDVGVITLLSLEGGAYEPLVKSFGSDGALLVRAERFHFGFDHTTLGAACLRRWELPEPICAVVERHHTPQNPQPRPVESQLLPVLRLSDHLARAMNRVRGAHELADSLIEHEANRFLGLEPRDAADLAGMLRDDRAEVRHFV